MACHCVTIEGNVVNLTDDLISKDHMPIVSIIDPEGVFMCANGAIIKAADLTWIRNYYSTINTTSMHIIHEIPYSRFGHVYNKLIRYLELSMRYKFQLPIDLEHVISYKLLDSIDRSIQLIFDDGQTDNVMFNGYEMLIGANCNYVIDIVDGYIPPQTPDPIDFEIIESRIIKVDGVYLNHIASPRPMKLYRSGELYVCKYEHERRYRVLTRTNTTVKDLIGHKIYCLNEAQVPFYRSEPDRVHVLPMDDVEDLWQWGRKIISGHTECSIDDDEDIYESGQFNIIENLDESCTPEYLSHNGNIIYTNGVYKMYNRGDKYYNLNLMRKYPMMSGTNLPNCYISRYRSISLYNADTFVFDGHKTILAPIVTRIKNITFSGKFIYYLAVEFIDGTIINACVINFPNDCLLFENGEQYNFVPEDGKYYCKYGQYTKLDIAADSIKGRRLLVIGNKYVVFRHGNMTHELWADDVIYECCGNYIAVCSDLQSVTFGEVIFSLPSKTTKSASHT